MSTRPVNKDNRNALVPLPSIELSVYSALPKQAADRKIIDGTGINNNNKETSATKSNRPIPAPAASKKYSAVSNRGGKSNFLPWSKSVTVKTVPGKSAGTVAAKPKTSSSDQQRYPPVPLSKTMLSSSSAEKTEDLDELKSRLRQQSAEINEIKEALRNLATNQSQIPKSAESTNRVELPDQPQENLTVRERDPSSRIEPPAASADTKRCSKDAQCQTEDVADVQCPRCFTRFYGYGNKSCGKNDNRGTASDEDKENKALRSRDRKNRNGQGSASKTASVNIRFDDAFSQFSPPNKGGSEFSVFESNIAATRAFYDNDAAGASGGYGNSNCIGGSAPGGGTASADKNEKRFFEKMIGIAQKWERAQGSNENGERYIKQQVSVVHRMSTKDRHPFSGPAHQFSLLLDEAERNPALNEQMRALAERFAIGQHQLRRQQQQVPPITDRFTTEPYMEHDQNGYDDDSDTCWTPPRPSAAAARFQPTNRYRDDACLRQTADQSDFRNWDDDDDGRNGLVSSGQRVSRRRNRYNDQYDSPERAYSAEVLSVCSRDYFKRHGLL